MNAFDLRTKVIEQFHEGQQLTIRVKDGEKGEKPTKAKIIKFYPAHVMTSHDGYNECFSYWEFLQITSQKVVKPKKIHIPDKLKKQREGLYA